MKNLMLAHLVKKKLLTRDQFLFKVKFESIENVGNFI